MERPEIVDLVNRLGGVAARAAILQVFTRAELELAVAQGRLRIVARGRYATYDVDESVVAARSVSGVLSGLSAAQWWGWAVKTPPGEPVVTVARNRAVSRPGVDVRRRDLPAGSIVDDLVTSRVQTVVDCARDLPFDEALSVADSALRDPRVGRSELREAARQSPRTGRPRVLRVVDLADGRADNPFESCVRAIALDVPGLNVVPQYQVGANGWADLVDPVLKIVVECDSWAFHSGEDLFRRDVRRYTDMVRRGWLVVRFVWEDAMHRPDRVRQALLDVVSMRLVACGGLHSSLPSTLP
jgi:very-short-patch-repair endonuclease